MPNIPNINRREYHHAFLQSPLKFQSDSKNETYQYSYVIDNFELYFRLNKEASGIWVEGLAPWDFEVSIPGAYLSTFLLGPYVPNEEQEKASISFTSTKQLLLFIQAIVDYQEINKPKESQDLSL